MALHVPRAPGFASMMKDGSKFFSGLEEAVIRNIGACKEFAETVQTCYGPNGMNKMVINHLEKLFVTNDAATIIRELEVEHPAAKLLILGSQTRMHSEPEVLAVGVPRPTLPLLRVLCQSDGVVELRGDG